MGAPISQWYVRLINFCSERSCKRIPGKQVLAMLFWTRFVTFVFLIVVHVLFFRVILTEKKIEIFKKHELSQTYSIVLDIDTYLHLSIIFVYLCLLWIGLKQERKVILQAALITSITNLIIAHGIGIYVGYIWFAAPNMETVELINSILWALLPIVLNICEIYFVKKYSTQLNSPIVESIIQNYQSFDNDCASLFEVGESSSTSRKKSKRLSVGGLKHLSSVPIVDLDLFKRFLISPWHIIADKGNVLGVGRTGTVVKGHIKKDGHTFPVALKTANNTTIPEELSRFVKEIKLMIYVGNNENIVKFYGITSNASIQGHLSIIMEYCVTSLERYLFENMALFLRNEYINIPELRESISSGSSVTIGNFQQDYEISSLLQYAKGVASGMEFLAAKKMVHSDLSCRNILLSPNNCVKITDFGIAHKIRNYQMYHRPMQNETFFPWRHAAVEVMEDLKFSEKSDVWSVGVVFWEIFSFCQEKPYAGLCWSSRISQEIRNGLRLEQPKSCPDEVFDLMLSCWDLHSERRPTFKKIRFVISQLLKKTG